MTPRRAVLGGFATGAVVGLVLVALGVALLPAATAPAATPFGSPSASASPREGRPTATPGATASPGADASSGGGPRPAPSTTASFMVGEPAPPLVVPQVGGGTIELAALRGRPVWLTFMATWCPSCREDLPRMVLAAARHAADGLVVLAVDVGEDEGTVAAYFAGLGVQLPVGLDPDGTTSRSWRVLALPVHFWIDAQGIVRFGALGGVGPDVFAEGLGTIVPGSSPSP